MTGVLPGYQTIVFIDPRVPDLQALIDGAQPGEMVFVLNADTDGVQQIADILAANNFSDLASIDIVSHGTVGQVQLGSTFLNESNVANYSVPLASIGSYLAPGGDLLLYGCDVAAGDAGKQFIADLSSYTGADVAAATHDVGSAALGGSWTLDASTGPIEAIAPFTADALTSFDSVLAGTIDGQLWYTILDTPGSAPGAPPGTPPRSVGGYLNSDGTSITPDGPPLNPNVNGGPQLAPNVPTGFNISLDTAAGLMFVGNSDGLTVSVYNIKTNTLIETIQVGSQNGSSNSFDWDIVTGIAVDPINHVLFVSRWDSDLTHTGLVKISYNPTAATPIDTTGNANLWNGAQTFLITNQSTGGKITSANTMDIDVATHKLYYTDWDNQYSTAPFSPQNAIYVVNDYTLASPTVTRLTTAAQFPTNASSGFIVNLAVDDAKGLLYFTTGDYSDPGQGHLWYTNLDGSSSATKIADIDNVNLGDGVGSGLTLDPVTQQLYLSLAAYDPPAAGPYPNAPSANANKVLVYQLSNDGHTLSSLVASYTLDQLEGQTSSNTGGSIGSHPGGSVWNQLPVLSVTGSGTHAVEPINPIVNGTAVTLASLFTSSDADGGYYSSATVKVTAGTFSSNESSANDDHLSVNLTTSGGKLVIGGVTTNISASYNSASETLTLSGYETIARYNAAMSAVQYFTTGDNPTNYGTNTSRTLTWTVNDGSLNVTAGGGQNSGTTTLNIDAVNDGPVNTVPVAAPSGNEDSTFVLSGISVSDVDADPVDHSGNVASNQNIIVALSVLHGTLSAGNVADGSTVGSGTATVTLTGTQNAINTVLAGLQYSPTANFNGTAETLTITTNDQSHTGSGGAQQTQTTRSITVNAVNDAPTVTSGTATLSTILEDGTPAATTITSLLTGNFSDALDNQTAFTGGSSANTFAGIAVTGNAASAGQGTWQWSTDGNTWNNIATSVSSASALVLAAATQIRFAPAANFNGSVPALTVHLIDNSISVTNNTTVNISAGGATGGTTAYSSGTVAIGESITAVNDAPTIVNGATASLTSIAEDTASPSGQSVSTVIASHFSDATDQVTGGSSANNFAGIAISANAATSQGTWQWSTNGTTWNTISSSLTDATALLVAATSQLRFIPAANFNGSVPALTIHLVEDSSGAITSGNSVNLTTSGVGGITQYSSGTVAVSESVTNVNDAPTVINGSTAPLTAINEDAANPGGQLISAVVTGATNHFADATDDQIANGGSSPNTFAGVAISANAASASQGVWQWSTDGNTWNSIVTNLTDATSLVLAATTQLRFLPAANFNGTTPALTTHLIDNSAGAVTNASTVNLTTTGTGGTTQYSTATVTINEAITAVNDAPTLVNGSSVSLATIAEDTASPAGTTVTSVLGSHFSDAADSVAGGSTANNFAGIAIFANTANAVTQGTWQWSSDGSNWNPIASGLTNAAAVLVAASDQLRFVPATDFNGAAPVLSVVLVDDSGVAVTSGTSVDISGVNATGGTTRYSAIGSPASVGEAISEANDTPVPGNPTLATINEDGGVDTITFATLMAGDTTGPANESGQSLTLQAVGNAVGGTVAIVLGQVEFTPTANFNGTASFDYTIQDNGTTNGQPDPKSAVGHATFTVTAVNDPVTAAAPATMTVAKNSQTAIPGLSISDVDALLPSGVNGVYQVTLTATHGLLTVDTAGNSLTVVTGDGTDAGDGSADGTATFAFKGTLAHLNAALAGAKFTPDNGYTGPAIIGITVTDDVGGVVATGTVGTGTSNSQSISVSVANPLTLDLDANNSSGATGSDYNALFTGSPIAVVDTDVTITDPGTSTMASATVTLTNHQTGDLLQISGSLPDGIAATRYDSTTGVLTLEGTASLPTYQSVLKQVQFVDGGNSTANRTITVQMSDGLAQFATHSDVTVGSAPSAILSGSLNATTDAFTDLAVTNQTDGTVQVLLGNGSGGFTAQSAITVGTSPSSIAIGSLNSTTDALADLVVANQGDSTVQVLLGNGLGGFTPQTAIGVQPQPNDIAIGSLNSTTDSLPDLVITTAFTGQVQVLLGDGLGGFTAQSAITVGSGASAGTDSVAIGSFNSTTDSLPDLVVANYSDGTVQLLLGNGTGGFTPQTAISVGTGARSVEVADLNGDSKSDLVVANNVTGNVSVLLGNGDGTFQSPAQYATGQGADSVAIADVNGDGKLDLVVANGDAAGTVSVLYGNGTGTFNPQIAFDVGAFPSGVAVGIFDGNASNDIATTNTSGGSVSVLLNNGTVANTTSNTGTTTVFYHSVDLDGNDSNTVGTGFTATFTENPGGSGPVAIADTDAAVTSPSQITAATITIASNYQAGADALAFTDTADITTVSNTGNVLTLTSSAATTTQWAAALATITYSNASDTLTTADRDITVVLSDGSVNTNTAHSTIHVVATNDAPVLTPAGKPLAGITEDNTNPPGASVASLRGGVVDPDSPSLGIAINGTVAANGHWEYSLNGGVSWTAFPGTIDTNHSLLLRDTDFVRYVPDAQNGSTDSFTYLAWDQSGATAGQQGTTFDTTNTGGSTPFSAAATPDTVTTTISPVNDAPVLAAASPTLTSIDEDNTTSGGQLVSAIVGATITDVDNPHLTGIAVSATTAAHGHWEFELGNSGTWTAFPTIDATHFLLLDAADSIRFVPDANNGGTDTITYHAWDETVGLGGNGTTIDPAGAFGGTGAFSTGANTATLTVTDVNDAPVITGVSNPLASVTEDNTNPPGASVGSLRAGATDVDSPSLGIAVTIASASHGHWEYSLDSGLNWTTFPSVSANQALLLRDTDFVRYMPDTEQGSGDSLTYVVWDQSGATAGQQGTQVDASTGGGTTPFSSTSASINTTITDVNDAPTLTPASPALAGITEDQTTNGGQPVSDLVTASAVSDVDASPLQGIAITSTVNGNGHWEYSTDGGLNFLTVGAVDGAHALLLRDVDKVRFVPDAQNGTSASFTYRAWDQTGATAGQQATKVDTSANGGTSPFSTATDTVSIAVASVNDPPNVVADTGSASENENKSFDVLANDTDVDIGDTKTLDTLLTVDPAVSGNSQINNLDVSSAFSVVAGQIQFLPGSLFDPLAAGQSATVTVHYAMHDSQNATASSVLTLTVNGTNDAPVLANVAPNAAYAPNSPPVDLSPGSLIPAISVTDVDNTTLGSNSSPKTGATVVISNGSFLGDVLAVNGQSNGVVPGLPNITAVYNPGNFTLTLSGADTLAHYAQALEEVTFQSLNGSPTNGGLNASRTLDWQVNDASALNNLSTIQHSTISLHTLDLDGNDSTAISTGFANTFTEHGPAVVVADSDVVINDVDSATMTSATVTLTDAKPNDSLAVSGALPAGITSSVDTSVPGQITLTLSGADTIAHYQTALHQVVFNNSSGNPDGSNRDISIVVTDSLNVQTNPAPSTISVVLVNDAPVVDAAGGSLTYTENQAATPIDAALTVNDVDSATLVGATVSITGSFTPGEDILGFVNQNSITGNYDPATGILTLTGVSTVANYQAALRSVTYFNSSDNPSSATRSVSFAVDDGSVQNHASNVAAASVSVIPVNDAPVNTVPGAQSVNEDTDLAIAGLAISDVDAGSGTLTTTLSVAHGTLTVASAGGAGVAGSGTGSITLTGTLAQINTTLSASNNVLYRGVQDFNGGDVLSIVTNDGGNTGTGGALSDTDTVAITVNAVNDAPVNIVPGAQSVNEDTSLAIAGLAISDVDAGSGTLTTTLSVAHGTLTIALAGGAGIAGSGTGSITLTGTLAQINTTLSASNNVLYQGAQDFSGGDLLSFVTNDGGNTGTGGALSDTDMVAITVNAVNDAPVNTLPATFDVEANTTAALAGLSVADPDAGSGTITTTLSVGHGTLAAASAGGALVSGNGTSTLTLTGTVAAIDATLAASGNLTYHGAHDFFGADTLTMTTNDGGNTGSGGALNDTDTATIHVNTLLAGTAGNDSFTALPGNERIDGNGGIDTITFNFKLVDATVSFVGNQIIVDGPTGSHTVLSGSFEVFNFTDGTVNNNDGNPLVDDLYYYSQYHDVWNAHADADAHYNTFGWHELRNPDPFFDTGVYLSIFQDVRAAGVNPLIHYDTFGWKEGRIPSLNFDGNAYLNAYPDIKAAGVDPLAHFLQFGAGEGRTETAPVSLIASDGFDYVYYLQHNPDVLAAHVDPLQHYLTFGWLEGRNPNALFDNNGYLAAYPDVAAAHVNPLVHYDTFGWQEGRDPSINFDTTDYLAAYPDVAAAHIDPLKHYLQFGQFEGRSAFADGHFG